MKNPKVVLITGSCGGIGRAIVNEFLREETYRIIALHSGKTDPELCGSNIEYYPFDFSDPSCINEMDGFINKYTKIDILINNAGAILDNKIFLNIDSKDIKRSIDVNFNSAFHLCKLTIPLMINNNFGRIINISSNTVKLKGSISNFTYYLGKGMLDILTKYISKHYSNYNITCNSIRPGLINSGMHLKVPNYSEDMFKNRERLVPGGASGSVNDIASMVKYLSLDTSGFISGQVISISKGE
jgi:NAD(P)-dependent dehydrogenase (short-subunit alcohol dehydrogenase family)